MLEAAAQEKSRPVRYALLDEARTIAARGQEPALAMEAVAALEKGFEIDGMSLRRKTLQQAAADAKTSTLRAKLLAAVDLAVEAAVAREDYAAAAEFVDVALAAVEGPGNASQQRRYKEQRLPFAEWAELVARATAARDTLKTLPDDPAANLAQGRYLCEVRGDFPAGLKLLAKGPAPWNAAAALELTPPGTPETRLRAAEAWQAVGSPLAGRAKFVWLGRAARYLSQALPVLTGVTKVKAETQLKTLVDLVPEEFRKDTDR